MLKINEKFSPRANPPDSNYPYGSIKNESAPGAKDGTPLDADWGNDYAGFDAALLDEADIVANGNADTVVASQRLDALKQVSKFQAIAPSLNVPSSAVIKSTNTTQVLDNVQYIYDMSNETTWSKPSGVQAGDVIISVVDDQLEVTSGTYTMLKADDFSMRTGMAYTIDYVDFEGTDSEIRSALDLCFSENSVIQLSPGIYPDYKIIHSNKTLFSTKDVIFKLPDNSSTAINTVAKMTLEIAASGITINGDITIDGNEAGNSRAAMNNSDRRGAFAVNHDRFTHNGDVIIPSAYWVGVSIGYEGKTALDVEIERIRVITASSYNFHAWACDGWKVGTIIVEDGVQDFDNRIQTGTESASSTACKNGVIDSVIALNTYVVFEINTITLNCGSIFCSGGKTEDATDVTIQNFVSRDLTLDANGFASINTTNLNVDTLTVTDYDGLQEEVVQFSGSSSDVSVGNLTVTGTKERVGNSRSDLVIYGGNGLYIGNAVLKDSASVGGHGLFVNNITTLNDLVIDNLISRNHQGNDINFNQFNDPEIQINKVNSDATSNVSFTENVGIYDEQTVTVSLDPQTSGTITLANTTMSVTKRDRMVTVNGTISASVGTPPVSPAGALRLTGLPFTCFNSKRAESAITIHTQGLASGFVGRVEGRIIANTNYIELWRVDNENFFDLSQHIQGGTELTISLSYPVR